MVGKKTVSGYTVSGYKAGKYLTDNLSFARYVAVRESMRDPRPYVDYAKGRQTVTYRPMRIDRTEYTKSLSAKSRKQVGSSQAIGTVRYIPEKERWIWITSDKTPLWIFKSGRPYRKLTKSEMELYYKR